MSLDFPGGAGGPEPACQHRRQKTCGSIPGSGRPPWEGHGNPLQYSCLQNPSQETVKDREARRAAGHGVWVRHNSTEQQWTTHHHTQNPLHSDHLKIETVSACIVLKPYHRAKIQHITCDLLLFCYYFIIILISLYGVCQLYKVTIKMTVWIRQATSDKPLMVLITQIWSLWSGSLTTGSSSSQHNSHLPSGLPLGTLVPNSDCEPLCSLYSLSGRSVRTGQGLLW